MIQINTLEEFKDVQDWYYVKGDTIYSDWSGELKALKPHKVSGEYHRVFLQTKNSKKQKGCLVHRIVCTAYNPNPDPAVYTEVNHINHDPSDNRPKNLEWVTPSGNTTGNNIWMEKRKEVGKTNQKKIMLYDVENCKVIVFQSVQQCADYLGVTHGAVSNAIKNGHKCQGYILKYIEKTKNTKKFAEI